MKKYTLYLFMTLVCLIVGLHNSYAQRPGINFEAIAKDKNNNPAKDRRIYVQVDIIPAIATNTPFFSEQHVARTNEAGIFNISIGKGTKVGGSYNSILDIPWSRLNYLVKVKIAIEPIVNVINWNYQNEWIEIGSTPFGIVPYAGTALTAERIANTAAVTSISGGMTGLTPATASTGDVVLGGVLSIANGGTGSSIKNFVDLNSDQTVSGNKIFSQQITASSGIISNGFVSLVGANTALLSNGNAGNSGDVLVSQGANSTPAWVNLQQLMGIKSKNRSTLLTAIESYEINVSGLDNNDGISVVLEAITTPTSIPNYYVFRDIPNNKVRVHFTAPYYGYVSWVIVE